MKLLLVPAPVIVRLVLPERRTGHSKNFVREPRGYALQCSSDLTSLGSRRNQNVHVVRHHHVFMQLVTVEFSFATLENA